MDGEHNKGQYRHSSTKLFPGGGRTRQYLLKAISTYEFNALNDPVRPTNGFYQVNGWSNPWCRATQLFEFTNTSRVCVQFYTKMVPQAAINASTAFIRTKPVINLYSGIGLGNNPRYDLYLINAMDFVIAESQINYKVLILTDHLLNFCVMSKK